MKGYYPAYAEPSRPVKGVHKTYYTAMPKNQPCPICGQTMRDHEKCRACRALAGPEHSIERLYDGLCEGCIGQRYRNPGGAAQVRAAIARNVGWE
jgi:hypothetical protein